MARKKKKVLENPFVYQGYENPNYFCDRTEETENVLSALRNGRNITLISPRKIGKTGLINHAFYCIKEQESDVICIYIDIFSTNTLQDFVEILRPRRAALRENCSTAFINGLTAIPGIFRL